MTPDSCISSIRSLPSRVRSPTPEKTDTPPCWRATLWISSVIVTVLPTPAPPKRPTLPPRTNGAIRSTTLMPVSKISIVGERSPNAGGSRWIGQRSPFAGFLAVDRVADDVPDPAERLFADGHRDRRCRCRRSRRRGRARRSSPWRPRGRDRRRGAAAPPRSARACRRPSGTWMRSAWLISGSWSGKTASSTTPLISTIFPVFLPLLLSATESPLMLEVGAARRRLAGTGTPAKQGSCSSVEPTAFAKLAGMAETDVSAAPFSGRTAWTRNLQRRSAASSTRRRAARPSSLAPSSPRWSGRTSTRLIRARLVDARSRSASARTRSRSTCAAGSTAA